MKRMTSILAMLLALAMLLSMVGCSRETGTSGKRDDTQGTTVAKNNGTVGGSEDTSTTGGDVGNATGNIDTSVPTEGNDEPDVYVISGKWKFNDTLVMIELENPTEYPEFMGVYGFEIQNITYSINGILYEDSMISILLDLLYQEDNMTTIQVIFYADTAYVWTVGWKNAVYQTIDFGDIPQEVSKDFYNWMNANATKQ